MNILQSTNTNLSFITKLRGKYILYPHLNSFLFQPWFQWRFWVPFFQFLPALYTLCVSHGKTEEAGLPACGWHMRSFLKCHWAWCTDDSRLLLAFTTFCNRCSRWTSAPVFLKCTQIKRYHVLDVKSFLLPWIIFCVHDSATEN